jgi:6-phosphofructokinase 1
MKIGILTGGGDVPGLNACVKAIVNRLTDGGHKVLGIRRGWGGLLGIQTDDKKSIAESTVPLQKETVRTIDRTGGTFLHTSRANPSTVIDTLKIDALIPIGGDDTLSYALRLHEEGIPVVGIPKTMDNDVRGTDYCIGFSTSVTRSVNMIHNLRTSAGSHERIAVIELFGRYSGETSLVAAYLSGVDRAVISEVPFDPEKLANFLLNDKKANPSNYAMMTISEGATMIGGDVVVRDIVDAYGHKKLGGIGAVTGDMIKQLTGENIIYQQLAYLMRSGSPDSLDLMVATNFAVMAADLVITRRMGRLVSIWIYLVE